MRVLKYYVENKAQLETLKKYHFDAQIIALLSSLFPDM